MATAKVLVQSRDGQFKPCRIMLDNASSSNLITRSCVDYFKLSVNKTNVQFQGIGQQQVGTAKGMAHITFYPHFDTSTPITIEAFIVPKITSLQPEKPVNIQKWKHIENLQLADPEFYRPQEIDILVGAEYFYDIVDGDKKKDSPNAPTAIKSELGWLIGGGKNEALKKPAPKNQLKNHMTMHKQIGQNITNEELNHVLKKFWEIEACKVQTKMLSSDEEYCEQHFMQTFNRTTDGRFVVKYPFKSSPKQLGESLHIAIRRFNSVERRLTANDLAKKEYLKFMREYESFGHMVEVEPPSATSNFRCYLPHHFVTKESSTTTKFRVVFDASAKTANGISLNDIMHPGPSIQDLIANLIMRFRKHKISITADIEKMYRQILVSSEDQELQHIVWRESPDKPIKHFRLLTITYGTAAGPYLATKVLQLLADLEEINFPIASKVLKQDFYIDDCMSGADNDEQAIVLAHQLIQLLDKAKMSIRKFTSNSEKLLQSLSEELRETKSLLLDKDAGIKALGVFWNPSKDFFGFRTDHLCKKSPNNLSKRQLYSEIAKLFDPIGWLAPIVINAKILMQSVWKENVDWDSEVPNHITNSWNKFKSELPTIQTLKIPRSHHFHVTDTRSVYLVGFCDASEQAYCATVFLCTYDNAHGNTVDLITSKTRVAPVQSQSLPRLELSGALLLAELMPVVAEALKIEFKDMLAYTDSTLVLGWVKSEPYKYKQFIANRISEIQKNIPGDKWGFVKGIDNPADCGSRGITVAELNEHSLWWTGSPWLIDTPFNVMEKPEQTEEETKHLELRKINVFHTTNPKPVKLPFEFFNNISTFTKMQRAIAYVFRFANQVKLAARKSKEKLPTQPITSWLTTDELKKSLVFLISIAQEQEFALEIQALKNNEPLPRNSRILSLSPFLDKDGIIRVGGRLRHANIPEDKKHPILLPQHHPVTTKLIQQEHLGHLHAGPQTLLTVLQQRYWIVRGKDAIRKVIRRCIQCTRQRAATMQQVMADLPGFRVNPAFPFQKSGLDYAGPFLIKPISPRSKITIKCYICIFVCCVTRAIHLEVVSSASTSAFIATLRRFTARRGRPTDIYSDNGTNFVGANHEIKEFLTLIKSQGHNHEIATKMSHEGIKWHFNPPAAPHFGGLWEAGVKSTKYHLRRVMGLQRLTFEELTTLTTQIEAILNSRPLTPETTDPSDLRALTPGHFLIGKPVTTVPDPDVTEIQTNRLVRWQLIQQMVQQFWKRWSSEYITRLQQRPKWMQPNPSIEVGSMVLLKDENQPPLHWKLGRVIQVHPGADNHVRTVTVKTSTGEMKRPVVKLCLLPIEK